MTPKQLISRALTDTILRESLRTEALNRLDAGICNPDATALPLHLHRCYTYVQHQPESA